VSSRSSSDPSESDNAPSRLPTNFITTIRRPESAKRIKETLKQYDANVKVLENDNLTGVKEADIILLGCKPYMFKDILSAPGIKEALSGKLLISILAGVTAHQIEDHLYGSISEKTPEEEGRCRIVIGLPNTASAVGESMTVVASPAAPSKPLSTEQTKLVSWIFERIGKVQQVAPNLMDVSTALCGSGPAFMALILEGLITGAVAMGLPRDQAQVMAAQTMRGTTGLVLNGEHPSILKDKVTTPGGCTIGGLLVLEEGAVRGTVAKAVREATVVVGQLGKGVQGANGTRLNRTVPS
jgi:pyrroline-5-carboxylate reductase